MDFFDKHSIDSDYLESPAVWITFITCLAVTVVVYYILHMGCLFSSKGNSRYWTSSDDENREDV